MTSFSIRKAIIISYIVALAIILFFAVYTYMNMQEGEKDHRALNQTLHSLRVIENVFDDIQAMESAQRGYILSGDKSFLQPYYTGLSSIAVDSQRLKTLDIKTPERRRDIDSLQSLLNQKIDFIQTMIAMKENNHPEVDERIQSGKGKVLMNQIGGVVHKIEDEERLVLNAYNDHRDRVARRTTLLFAILAVSFFLFLLSFFFFVRRDVSKRLNKELVNKVNQNTYEFRDILDRISDGFVALDKDWHYVYLNKKALQILKKDALDVLGKPVYEVIPGIEESPFFKAYKEAMRKQEYVFLEGFHTSYGRWYENHIYPSPNGVSVHFRDITEKKETELQLKEANERFNLVSKATDDIMWEADLVKGSMWWNDNFYEKFGYNKEAKELPGRSWEMYLHPGDKEKVLRDVQTVLDNPDLTIWADEYRFLKADGSYLNIYDRCFIVRNKEGKAIRMIGSMADLTSIKQSEEKYRTLVEQATDGIFIADQSGKFIVVNSSGCKMSQYTEDELKNMTVFDLADPEELQHNPIRFSDMLDEKGARSERIMKRKDGTLVDVEINAKFLSDGRFLAFIRDITERKESLKQLQASEQFRRSIMDSALDAIVCMDIQGRITVWSSRATMIFGWADSEVLGRKISDTIIPPQFRVQHEAGMKRYLQTGEGPVLNKTIEISALNKEGKEFPVELSIVPVKNRDTEFFCAFIRDISGRKRAEEAIRKSNERFVLIARTTHDAIWEWNLETGELWANDVHQELYGLTAADPIPKVDEWKNRIHPDDREKTVSAQERMLVSDKNYWESEYRFKRPDGTYRTLFDRAYIVRDKNGKPIHLTGSMIDISERKKAEEEIKKSNERFELIARTTNEAIWEWDFETQSSWANDTHQELYGLHPTDAIPNQDDWQNRIYPADRAQTVRSFEKALKSDDNVWIAEYRFLTNNQGLKYIYDRTYILRDAEGKPIRMTGSMMDITEMKQAEEEITKAKELADRLIDSLPGVFYFYDRHGKFIRWNAQFEKVTEYSAAEIASMHPADFFEGEDKTYITERIQGVFEKGINDAETNFTTKSGKKIPYYFKAVLINYEGGPCLLGSGIDISERKKAEEELRISEKNYRSLVEQAADAIFIFNSEGRFIDVNSVSSELLGYTKEELLHMSLPDIVFAEELVRQPIMFEQLNRGESAIRRRNFKRKDGSSVVVEVHSKKLADGRYLGMVRDLTERIETERKLEESFEAIRRLTDHIQNIREEERSHIAREIHDELGQQLTVLKMDVAWLNKKVGTTSEPVQQKIKSLTEMIDGTVKTVRRISSELRPSLLDDMGLVATMDWHLKEFEKRSGIKTTFDDPELEPNLPDNIKTGLFRIFQECLTNIARHADATKVNVELRHKNGEFILNIADNGKGFDPEQVATKKTLGILGMKERAAMMGGTYETISEKGKGATVRISVPVSN